MTLKEVIPLKDKRVWEKNSFFGKIILKLGKVRKINEGRH